MNKALLPDIIETIKTSFVKQRLAYRLVFYVVLCSSVFTLLATGIQLYAGYRSDLDFIESSFKFVERSFVPAISTSLYKVDIDQLKLQLNGVIQLRDMIYVEVEEPREHEVFRITGGDPNGDFDITHAYPLSFKTISGENRQLGTIKAAASLDGVYERLIDRFVIVILTNAVKTFLASFCILLIFYYVFTRHISKITQDISVMEPDHAASQITLNRKKPGKEKPDELDQLVKSFNQMWQRIYGDRQELERMQKAIQRSEESLRSFIENSGEGIWLVELDQPIDVSLPPDDQLELIYQNAYIAEANDAYAKLTGFEKGEDMKGLRVFKFLPRTVPENVAQLKGLIRAKYTLDNLESIEVYPDGEKRVFLNNVFGLIEEGHLLRAWGTSLDITKIRAAEQNLKEAELRYRTVADFTYDWEYWESPEGEMLYVSPSCERISGYNAEAFINNPAFLQEIILEEDKGFWAEHRDQARSKSIPLEIEFRIRAKHGEIRWIEHACQPVHDAHGQFLGIRASNRDITNNKKMELETERLKTELTRMDRVNMMGVLTAGIAHEINQPLAAILSNAQAAVRFLTSNQQSLDEVKEALKDIISDDKRAGEMVHSIRNIMGGYDLKREEMDLNKTVREVLTLVKSEAFNRGISISENLQPDIPPVYGDRIQIQQVILNLMMNAMESQKEPHISKPEILVSTRFQDNKDFLLSVSDSGPGIEQDQLETIFDFFKTSKKEGFGIGLSICRSIADKHGGQLWAENRPEGGAIFLFRIPFGENRNE